MFQYFWCFGKMMDQTVLTPRSICRPPKFSHLSGILFFLHFYYRYFGRWVIERPSRRSRRRSRVGGEDFLAHCLLTHSMPFRVLRVLTSRTGSWIIHCFYSQDRVMGKILIQNEGQHHPHRKNDLSGFSLLWLHLYHWFRNAGGPNVDEK